MRNRVVRLNFVVSFIPVKPSTLHGRKKKLVKDYMYMEFDYYNIILGKAYTSNYGTTLNSNVLKVKRIMHSWKGKPRMKYFSSTRFYMVHSSHWPVKVIILLFFEFCFKYRSKIKYYKMWLMLYLITFFTVFLLKY